MPLIKAEDVALTYPVFGRPRTPAAAPSEASADPAGPWRGAGAVLPISGARTLEVEALRNVCFHLKAGDRLGLVGRNGSGKSTLLRILAGVYPPTRGRLEINGRVAPMFNVGLGVRSEATGRRNIILRGLMHGLTVREAEAKVDDIIAFSELGPYIDMPVRTYSSGMAMRLSFATATAFSPEILLLDEWIGAGDEDFQKKAAARMHSLVQEAGITVMASHRRQLIKQVCNYGLWLDAGAQRAFGPIDEVIAAWDEDYLRRTNAAPMANNGA